MKETELKPCPFCGKVEDEHSVHTRNDGSWVFSHPCDRDDGELTIFISVYGKTKEELINRWNRRLDNEQRETD